jgi:hypothetical protein
MSIAVHIINPGKKKAKKKSAGKKKAKKKPAAKKATRKKPAKKQKSAKKRPQSRRPPKKGDNTMAKKKTKAPAKKRKNPAPKKKKARRRKNPTGFGGIATEIKLALPRLIGKVVCAWAVKQFGGMNSGPDYERRSPMLGESWNGRGYMIAAGVAIIAPPLLRRIIGGHTQFRQGVIDLIVEKAVWTEGFARSEWMQGAFGNYGQVAYDPGTGQSYVDQGNDQWSAMQGLVDQSALDGLTERSVLDGPNSYIGPGDSYTQNAHAAYA